jgi:hypothetical protein
MRRGLPFVIMVMTKGCGSLGSSEDVIWVEFAMTLHYYDGLGLWRSFGLLRSIVMYYGIPFRNRALARFYARFVRPGELCFDIGAHVGNRLWAFSKMGARVVALEPQPDCMRLLRRWYGHHADIELIEQAVGSAPGTRTLFLSERTPTVSTISSNWIADVKATPEFARVR